MAWTDRTNLHTLSESQRRGSVGLQKTKFYISLSVRILSTTIINCSSRLCSKLTLI